MDAMQCSFCGKGRKDVRKLIAGPGVFICDACVGLCNGILDEEKEREQKLPAIRRNDGHVVLDDWAAICLDALECRILWPVIPPSERMLSRAHAALPELMPELASEETASRAIVIAVADLDRARALLRALGLFEVNEEVRTSGQWRAVIFRTADGHVAALMAT